MRYGWLGVALAAAFFCASPVLAADPVIDTINAAGAKIDKHDPAGARDILLGLLSKPGDLMPYEHYFVERLLAWAYLDLDDHAAALAPSRESTATEWADEADWEMRVRAGAWSGNYDDASTSLIALARKWPDKISELSDTTINQVTRNVAKSVSGDRAYALFAALDDAKWTPNDQFDDTDQLLFALTRYALERGDVEKAKAYGARVWSAELLIEMRSDKRFDAVVAAAPDHFDVLKALDYNLARYRALAAASPDSLEGVNVLAGHLTSMGRMDEALALLDKALARVDAGPAFSDQKDKLNWTYDSKANALDQLGRRDEAAQIMLHGAKLSEDGQPNVSQAINLADVYDGMGRPDDALSAVASVELKQLSPYGRMALQNARACAYAQLNRSQDLKPVLAAMKEHKADSARIWLETMVCTNDLEEAAAALIAALGDPAERGEILLRLQDYPPGPSAFAPDFHRRWLALRSRADVQAAIAKAGRIQSYPIPSLGY